MTTLQPIRLALDWAPNTNHAGVLVAHQRGHFAEAGVDAQFVPAERDWGLIEIMLAGEAELGFAFEGTVIERRALGEPFVAVAALGQRHRSALAVLRDSDITRSAELAGKRYASFGHAPLEEAIIRRMLAHDGAPDPAFHLTPVRFASVVGLVRGEYDFLWIYDGVEGVEAEVNGIALRTFAPSDYGIPNYYAPVIFARGDVVGDPEQREATKRFLAAAQRGYAEAAADPDGVQADILAAAPALGGWLFTNDAVTSASLRFQANAARADAAQPWGTQTLATWTDLPRLLWQDGALGAIPEPAYAEYFTNDLLVASAESVR